MGRGMSVRAEAQIAPRTRRGSHVEARHHTGNKVIWRSHKGILESVVLMTCPEVKGLLMRWQQRVSRPTHLILNGLCLNMIREWYLS